MTQTITARRLITDSTSVDFPVLTISDEGTIVEIGSDPSALKHETSTLTTAFLDIHTHGAMGHDVMTANAAGLAEMQRFLARHGVAHYLPTTATAPIEDTLRALEALASEIESVPREAEALPIGIHLEGPFLSHSKRGVHPADELQPPSIPLFDRLYDAARGHIALMTIAPELPAALDLIRHATSLGVRVSLGHSNATAAETVAAIEAGACSATHTFNAMRPLDHREPGIAGVVLDESRLFAELICDGIHVDPLMVRLWLKAKGPTLAILVTDAMSAAGMPDGQYALAGLPVTVSHGRAVLSANHNTLAGSVLTLDRAVANLQRFTQSDLATATRLASCNPAELLNQAVRTSVGTGACANLNRFDSSDNLIATYIRGVQVQQPLSLPQ